MCESSVSGKRNGRTLLEKIKEKYKDYLYIILIAENEGMQEYYSKNGFEYVDGRYMFVIQNTSETSSF